jgi:hypothetical protein
MEIAERPSHHLNVHQCVICGQPACDYDLELNQNTGALLMRYSRTYKGNMCRSCAMRIFKKVQVHNTFLGWWGTISFIVTPAYLLANTYNYFKFLSAAKKAGL